MAARLINATSAGLLAALTAAASLAAELEIATDTPLAVVESLQRALVAVADEPVRDVDARFAALAPVVTGTHDLEYIATLAVRRQWDALDSEQQAGYLAAFERLSIMSYARRFGSVAGDSFVAPTLRSESAEDAEVASAIRAADGREVSLDYVLRRRATGWRIVNIVADGVSDLALKRAEYRRILTEQTPEALIAELDRQAAELAADD